ncbi:MAG: electron transfer flavoprotein beta subunit [Planctomycetota bacterium]|jgi:electron transfer flavoprotein beta subunit
MKILVPISTVPDTTAKVAFTDGNTKFDTNNVTFILNPTDEWFALVRAIELKEKNGGTVTVINVGPATNDQFIRKALAIGADNAVRIDGEARDAFFVASQIAEHAKSEAYDLVITGKETIDFNGSQIGAMVSEILDMPYVSLVSKLELEGNTFTLDREIEGGDEVVSVDMPMVVSAQKGIAEQRIPNMRGIMQSRTKPLVVVPVVAVEERITINSFELPVAKIGAKMVDAENLDELVRLLHEEAKAI